MHLALIGVWLCLGAQAVADDTDALTSDAERINYSVGYQVGSDFKDRPEVLDPEPLTRGIADAVGGLAPRLTAAELEAALAELQRRLSEVTDQSPAAQTTPAPSADETTGHTREGR
jgi:FKBP-type peptidyl-prolyl cis-trans isomerase FklB